MRIERMTAQAREAVTLADHEARRLHHPEIAPAHILLGLLGSDSGAARGVLETLGLTYAEVSARLRKRRPGSEPGAFTDDDARALRSLGIDLSDVLARARASFGDEAVETVPPAREREPVWRRRRMSRNARSAITQAVREAQWIRSGSIDASLLLLGVLRAEDPEVTAIVLALGVEPSTLMAATLRTIGEAA
jgi:ATP-dependent Clp protease ATP-binding subunit ClpA